MRNIKKKKGHKEGKCNIRNTTKNCQRRYDSIGKKYILKMKRPQNSNQSLSCYSQSLC